MDSILVNTPSKQYPVYIGNNIIGTLISFIKNKLPCITKVFVITDETVGKLHLPMLLDQLKEIHPTVFQVPSGESAKTFPVFYEAMTKALEAGLDRKSLILTFGGGAVGDVGGFVAATFMRGIPFIQIPTTILAHDSAVGGKVAINHHLGKNLIGAFYQPEAVFYELNFLDTLPIKEKRSGFAEVIKHALIQDADFYHWLVENVTNFEFLTKDQLAYCLKKGIKIKAEIVGCDEKENGIRAYLNFGHTLGHAIESEMGYGEITHGEAVMIGIGFALKMSQELLHLNFDVNGFLKWVRLLGYRTEIPASLKVEGLVEKMKQDKKSVGQQVNFVLLEQLGQPTIQQVMHKTLVTQLSAYGQ